MLDALLPAEMAAKAESIGEKKANLDFWRLFVLAILAGAFIALGAVFSTTVITGAAGAVPFGIVRLLAGLSFSLGLILVVVGGAELFTGNTLIVMAWAAGRVPLSRLLRNWAIVYSGNFVGAFGTALLMVASRQYTAAHGAVGLTALEIASAKTSLAPTAAFASGILCNALVCLAIWLSFSGRSTADKILAVIMPVSAFVAAGFEHSIANMYFISVGLLIKATAGSELWQPIAKSASDFPSLDLRGFLIGNLLPVTLGNIVGGALLVGAVYWFVYLRNAKNAARP